jgi:hypothetical protein
MVHYDEIKGGDGTFVKTWSYYEFVDFYDNPCIRLHFKPRPGKNMGFDFHCIEEISYIDQRWDCETEILFYGTVRYDGLRHIFMYPESSGYGNYVNTTLWEWLFNTLSTLIFQHCQIEYLDKCYKHRHLIEVLDISL